MASWLQRTRERLEKLVFAGLKPDAPVVQKKSKLETFMASAEDLAARGLQPGEKALPGPITASKKLAIVAGILVIGVSIYGLVKVLQSPAARQESKAPPPAPVEIVPKGLVIEKNKGLEVVAINFNRTKQPHEITGVLRNLTGQAVAKCDVSFDLTTREGSQLGGVATTVHNLPPHGSRPFTIEVPQADAGFAMVRELRAE